MRRKDLENKLLSFIRYSRVAFLPFSLIAIASGQLLANNYDWFKLFLTSFSFLFLHVFISGSNFLHDVDSDQVSALMNKQNPILTGEITRMQAKAFNFIAPILAIITSFFAGLYWVLLTLIGIGLVYVYDNEPFRFKDTLTGLFIQPFNAALPFLFSYFNGVDSVIIPITVLLVFIFYYLNGLTAIRHIPDINADRKMKVRNFTAIYGVDATRYLEMVVSVVIIVLFAGIIYFTGLSLIGLPILTISTIVRLNLLIKPAVLIKEPAMWLRSVQMLSINMIAMLTSIVGNVFVLL